VGAGLPIIGTLNDLMKSGDTIHSIHAVLSGTLNYVFNHSDGKDPFAAIVKRAQNEGYTEPDPRLDLGGTDVMRKILILAREAGTTMEIEEVENHSFLPATCMEGTVEDFYNELAANELHFKALYENAQKNNCKLKFVAEFKNGKAEVGLRAIPSNSDFYHFIATGSINILKHFVEGVHHGITVTCPGSYGPQGRVLRLGLANPGLVDKFSSFSSGEHRISNFEMETSAIYALGKLLGYQCLSVYVIVANRIRKEFSKDGALAVENLIKKALTIISTL
jgi:hypothetical protein